MITPANKRNLIIMILVFIFVIYLIKRYGKIETLENEIKLKHPECKNMTYDAFLVLFEEDIDKLVDYLMTHNIELNKIGDEERYPEIADELVSKGILDIEVCKLFDIPIPQ